MQYLDSDYDIFEDGRCYSHKSHKYLTPQMTIKYPTYNLTLQGKKKKTAIHRMVAETFLPKIEGKEIVNHKDGNNHNFHLSNLEWANASENTQHAVDMKLLPKGNQIINKYQYDLPNEHWTDILDFPLYRISSCGRIMNKNTQRLLKAAKAPSGYLEVNLWKNGKGTTKFIHPLVYTSFTNDYEMAGFVINHKDGNKTNNNLDNLEKITYGENANHAIYVIKTNKCNKPVIQLDENFNVVNTFPSIAEAQRQTGFTSISRAIKKNYKTNNYYWKFKNENEN